MLPSPSESWTVRSTVKPPSTAQVPPPHVADVVQTAPGVAPPAQTPVVLLQNEAGQVCGPGAFVSGGGCAMSTSAPVTLMSSIHQPSSFGCGAQPPPSS